MPGRKILILTNRIPYPLNDGGSIAMNAMIEGYEKTGWEVFVFSMNTSRHYVPVEALPDLYKRITLKTFDIDTDIRFMPVLKNFLLSKKPNQAERFFNKEFDKELQKVVASFEPDMIQIESVYLSIYIETIRSISNARIALRLHNIEYQIWERLAAETQNSFKRYYIKDLAARIKRFEINAWKLSDLLIPITKTDADVVRAEHPNLPLIITPFGINIQKAHPADVEEKWVGYHIGAMDWMPNAEAITWFLESVWPKLHKQLPAFEFHFAGRNMPASFKKYEVEGVICAGEVADAKGFIADKKILVVPLKAGGGIRIKIMEAMAAGKLVVSTAIGMQGIEGAISGVHYLNAEDDDDFVNQLKWTMNHKDAALAISLAGAALISESYNSEKLMREQIQKIESIPAWFRQSVQPDE